MRASGRGRTAWDVDVHGHDRVDTLDHGVDVEDPAGAGAGAHGDTPFGLGHLVPNPAQHGGELIGHPSGTDEDVRLPGAEGHPLHAEARQIEVAGIRPPSSRCRSRRFRGAWARGSSSGPSSPGSPPSRSGRRGFRHRRGRGIPHRPRARIVHSVPLKPSFFPLVEKSDGQDHDEEGSPPRRRSIPAPSSPPPTESERPFPGRRR